jgi:hypothetical protein
MASTINGTSTGSGVLVSTGDDSGILNIQTNETTAITVDASQNVGVGVTPAAWGGGKNIQLAASSSIVGSNDEFYLASNSYFNGTNNKYIANGFATQYSQETGVHKWFIAPTGTAGNNITFTRAMTLDASGSLLIGQTSQSQTTVGFSATQSGVVSSALAASTGAANSYHLYSTGAGAYRFYVSLAGTVFATSTSISAISDERLKENVRPLDLGLNEIMALQPRRYDWKEGKGQDKKDAVGFVAQEFEQVLPNSVGVSKAGEDGIEYKNINYEELVPTLVKAIQEQQALIETLTQRITALEGA